MSKLRFDARAVAELADELARFAGSSVFANARAANEALNTHAPFGVRSASGFVVAARAKYSQNLTRVVGTVHEFAREAALLAVQLRKLVAMYEGTDAKVGMDVAVAGRVAPPGPPPGFIGPVAPRVPQAEEIVYGPRPAHVAEPEAREREPWQANWSAYNTLSLWQMARPDSPDAGAVQAKAWRDIADALNDHAIELIRKRDALMNAWSSPEASDAALARFDGLKANMLVTASTAYDTAAVLERINDAVKTAQQELDRLAAEYQRVSDDWTVRSWDKAEDRLNEDARVAMAELERAVYLHAQRFPEVPKFRTPGRIKGWSPPEQPTTSTKRGPFAPQTPPPPTSRDVSPIITGGGEWKPTPRIDPPPRGGGLDTAAGAAAGVIPGVIAGAGAMRPTPATAPRGPLTPFGGPPRPVLPPVIGQVPATPPATPLGPGGRPLPPGAVPPVFGAPPTGTGAGAGAGATRPPAGTPMMPGTPGAPAGRGRPDTETGGRARRRDVVWEVDKGLPPVIEASKREIVHDPGPGVYGIDR